MNVPRPTMMIMAGAMVRSVICGLVCGGHCTASAQDRVDAAREEVVQKATATLLELAQTVREQPTTADQARTHFLDLVVGLDQRGLLRPALSTFLELARTTPALAIPVTARPPEVDRDLIEQLAGMIEAEISMRGRGRIPPPFPIEDWPALTAKIQAKVHSEAFPPRGPDAPSWLVHAAFLTELARLARAEFVGGNRVQILAEGPAAFAERARLIDEAKESLWILSWAFYSDHTGFSFAQQLIDRHAQGVDVRIMVDGSVAQRAGHDEVTRRLEMSGIPVIRWRSAKYPQYGMHRKLLIADRRQVLCGGRNFGDVYSHLGVTDEKKRWRDTEVLVEGPAVSQATAHFARLWNEAAAESDGAREKVLRLPIFGGGTLGPDRLQAGQDDARVAFVDHHPARCNEDPICLMTIKAIAGATQVIEISNAYFVPILPLRQAILDALRRGVRVRILTNSTDSLDEPILQRPIVLAMLQFRDAGAEVYLQQGPTLHSKFLVVDGRHGWVGSYNLHPRSYRFEGELVAAFLSEKVGRELSNRFALDATAARHLLPGEKVEVPESLLSELSVQYFFDQL